MKVLEAIQATKQKRVPVGIGRVSAVFDANAEPGVGLGVDTQWQVSYEARIRSVQTGPEKALGEMTRRAKRIIADEAFGEITSDLLILRELLWEDAQYRAPDDPILTQVETMLRKTRGDD